MRILKMLATATAVAMVPLAANAAFEPQKEAPLGEYVSLECVITKTSDHSRDADPIYKINVDLSADAARHAYQLGGGACLSQRSPLFARRAIHPFEPDLQTGSDRVLLERDDVAEPCHHHAWLALAEH